MRKWTDLHALLMPPFMQYKCNTNVGNTTDNTCYCTSLAWRGEHCELLALQPTPAGSDFNELESAGLSTWGASIVQLPPDKQWHMYVR